MNRKRLYLGSTLALLGAAGAHAAGIGETELLLRNRLGVPRSNEVVIVSLRDLAVAPGLAEKIRSATVTDEAGRRYPAQFDVFPGLPALDSEIAFEADLAPDEARRVVLAFDDAPAAGEPGACSVKTAPDAVTVSTLALTAVVRDGRGDGLWVEQPELAENRAQKRQKADDALMSLLADDAPAGGDSAKNPAANALKPPMSPRGLPFCVQGMPGFSPAAKLSAQGGPVRALVSLIDSSPAKGASRQTFWFPRSRNAFYFDLHLDREQESGKGRIAFAGLRVNSADHPWSVLMGQDGKPPLVAPVRIPLAKTGRQPYLEGYQKSTFNHVWAQAATPAAWVTLIVDRDNSRLGTTTEWDSGRIRLDNRITYSDPGPFANSLQPEASFTNLPAGFAGRVRALFQFGARPEPPGDAKLAASVFASPLPVPRTGAAKAPPGDMDRLRQLAKEKNVLVVVPDSATADRQALWTRLAKRLGGTWRPSRGVLHYYNTMRGGIPPKELLTVVVGEPGANPLLDQFNAETPLLSAYPLQVPGNVTALVDESDSRGPVLFLGGNSETATAEAVENFIAGFGDTAARQAATLSWCDWAERMPFPWSGLKEHAGPFTTLAYRNGHAEFLILLRANEALEKIALTAPTGSVCRFVPWLFESEQTEPRVVPLHDAAFAQPPSTLAPGALLTLWISIPVPAEAKPGIQRATAFLEMNGARREIALETEILPPVLPAQQALGFYPMGFEKSSIRQYYDWDEETYLKNLPNLLRQRREFGANAFTLDSQGLSLITGGNGPVSIDSTGFRRELEAVRAAGGIDLLMIGGMSKWNLKTLKQFAQKRRLADEFEALEYVVPPFRQALKDMDLEGTLTCRYADEIGDYESWLAKASIFRRCGLRMTVAINGYGVFNKQLGVGTMGLWIPLYNFYLNRWGNPIAEDDPQHFSKKFRDARHAAGEPVWPYVCGPGPYAWSARPRSQARFLILDTFMKGADGLSYYGGTVWSQANDPAYRATVKADLLSTDATFVTLFYPDPAHAAILPSLRAGAFRLGLEDAGATRALRDLAAAKGRLAAVEPEIEKAFGAITLDSGQPVFDAYRRTLGRLYDNLLERTP